MAQTLLSSHQWLHFSHHNTSAQNSANRDNLHAAFCKTDHSLPVALHTDAIIEAVQMKLYPPPVLRTCTPKLPPVSQHPFLTTACSTKMKPSLQPFARLKLPPHLAPMQTLFIFYCPLHSQRNAFPTQTKTPSTQTLPPSTPSLTF
jgi:hypothetical protein